jgi:3-oxoacyl-[acyl-carrier protein] reductase
VVFSWHVDEAAAQEVIAAVAPGRAVAVQADLGDLAAVRRLIDRAAATTGTVDILVGSAGILRPAPIVDLDEAEYDRTMAVNAKGTFFAVQAAARAMADGGRIVVVSTVGTVWPSPGEAVYAASKAAVEQLVRVASRELGPRGITVNAVAPGPPDIDLLRAGTTPQVREAVAGMTALGRHHAQLLQVRGAWEQAEREALSACRDMVGIDVFAVADAYYEVGEVRRLRGDLAGAEAAYSYAHEHGRDPQPGLALLRLAQGKREAARGRSRPSHRGGQEQPRHRYRARSEREDGGPARVEHLHEGRRHLPRRSGRLRLRQRTPEHLSLTGNPGAYHSMPAPVSAPCGVPGVGLACDLQGWQPRMIAAMALRLLYLIFSRLLARSYCSDGRRHRTTSNCSSYATRSPYSAEPAPSLAWTGPTAPCSPHSSNACPRCCAVIAWSLPPRSCDGIAAW